MSLALRSWSHEFGLSAQPFDVSVHVLHRIAAARLTDSNATVLLRFFGASRIKSGSLSSDCEPNSRFCLLERQLFHRNIFSENGLES